MAIILYRHIPQRKICEPCETFFAKMLEQICKKLWKSFCYSVSAKRLLGKSIFPDHTKAKLAPRVSSVLETQESFI